jgi:DNA-directed RNA polymerase beta' subunit
MSDNFRHELLKIPTGDVKSISFSILNDEEILRNSSVEIITSELINGTHIAEGSLYDTYMGPEKYNEPCKTCRLYKNKCKGHPGHIQLSSYVQNPMFASEIISIIKVVCWSCGRHHTEIGEAKLMITEEKDKLKTLKSVVSAKGKSKDKETGRMKNNYRECKFCRYINPHVIVDEKIPNKYWYTTKEDVKTPKILTYNKMREIFNMIPEETVKYLGKAIVSHPKYLFTDKLYVPPTDIRPQIKRANKKNNADLTAMLKDIIQTNSNITNITSSIRGEEINEKVENDKIKLNNKISAYMIGKTKAYKVQNAEKEYSEYYKNYNNIVSRLKGKTKRIRANLVSKRVTRVCRAVASCDPTLEFNTVALPYKFAKILKKPEIVHPYNYDKLRMCLQNGVSGYPGCNQIITSAGKKIAVDDRISSTYVLREGDIVYRDLMDGDVVGLNREPSLWFASTTTMRIIVVNGSTIKFNPTINILHNADFDGDELTLYIYTSPDAIAEAFLTSATNQWIINYQHGKNMIGMFHDSIIAMYLLTQHSARKLTKIEAMSLLRRVKNIDHIAFEKEEYTGREIISMILPKSLNFTGKPYCYKEAFEKFNVYHESDKKVVIENGKLVSGVLDVDIIGQKVDNGIFHHINFEDGPWTCIDVAHAMQQIGIPCLEHYGITFGVNDLEMTKDSREKIKTIIARNFKQSEEKLRLLDEGKIIPPIGVNKEDFNESLQMKALEQGDDLIMHILNGIDIKNNWLYHFIMSGSKGQLIHFKSLLGCIAQTSVLGKRIPTILFNRASCYYARFDPDPQSRGFNPSSFSEGTAVGTALFQATETRTELTQTAVGTAAAGDQNRNSVKNMEPILISNMRNVCHNSIVLQNIYSGDGIDPRHGEKVKIPTIKMSDEELKAAYYTTDEEFANIKRDRDEYRDEFISVEQNYYNILNFEDKIRSPFNMERIMKKVGSVSKKNVKIDDSDALLTEIEKFLHNLRYVYYNKLQEKLGTALPDFILRAIKHKVTYIRAYLNIKTMGKYNITTIAQLHQIFTHIIQGYQKALIAYGKTIGIIAGQCVSEILTQGIIDSKHNSGIAAKRISPLKRFNEILKVVPTKKMANPDMTIYIREDYFAQTDSDTLRKLKVQNIANKIEMLQLSRFISSSQIFIEPPFTPSHEKYKDESALIIEYLRATYGAHYPTNVYDWCIRYELNMEEMTIKNITIGEIIDKLTEIFVYFYIVPYIYKGKYVIRIYFTNKLDSNSLDRDSMIVLNDKIKETIIRGVSGIRNTELGETQSTRVNPKTGSLETKKEYTILTDGINYDGVILTYGVDAYRTTTNSIQDTELHFGIEQARTKIITEIYKLIKGKINIDHCAIYADEMTYIGKVVAIQRSGMYKRDTNSVMLMASYQNPIKFLEKGAITGKVDKIPGITPSLMIGRMPKFGTIYNQTYIDHEKIKKQNKELLNKIVDAM